MRKLLIGGLIVAALVACEQDKPPTYVMDWDTWDDSYPDAADRICAMALSGLFVNDGIAALKRRDADAYRGLSMDKRLRQRSPTQIHLKGDVLKWGINGFDLKMTIKKQLKNGDGYDEAVAVDPLQFGLNVSEIEYSFAPWLGDYPWVQMQLGAIRCIFQLKPYPSS